MIGGNRWCSWLISGVVKVVMMFVLIIVLYMLVNLMFGVRLIVIIGLMLLNVMFCRIGRCMLSFYMLIVCRIVEMLE